VSNIEQHVEALIFASEQSIRLEEIMFCLQAASNTDVTIHEVANALQKIDSKYQNPDLAIELVKINNGYQFLTKKTYHAVISQLQLQRSKKKLSQAALETLAIVAYKQPVTKVDIEQIRGVNCDYSIQKLLEKELITVAGRAETIGKPILYATSNLFADYMGINSIKDMPSLNDLSKNENAIGNQQE
jgi:segregation and condensation protein B